MTTFYKTLPKLIGNIEKALPKHCEKKRCLKFFPKTLLILPI